MGCDIHACVQWRLIEPHNPDYNPWQSFVDQQMRLPRDYGIFAAMAGVRNPDIGPVVASRGWPEIDHDLANIFGYYIVDDFDDTGNYSCGDRQVLAEHAKETISKGHAQAWLDGKYMEDPDLHTPSWLTCEEYWQAIKNRTSEAKHAFSLAPEYYSIGALMRELESRGREARIVFAFDN